MLTGEAHYIEAAIRVDRLNSPTTSAALDDLLAQLRIAIAPVAAEQARLAREACRRFGKSIHPAALNLDDCFSYALSQATGELLLFKGNDFIQTDVARC